MFFVEGLFDEVMFYVFCGVKNCDFYSCFFFGVDFI